MKFFADTAEIAEIRELAEEGLLAAMYTRRGRFTLDLMPGRVPTAASSAAFRSRLGMFRPK